MILRFDTTMKALEANSSEKSRVILLTPKGQVYSQKKAMPPCGACRELMTQIMPESYRDIEIMLDYESGRTVTLGELTPE